MKKFLALMLACLLAFAAITAVAAPAEELVAETQGDSEAMGSGIIAVTKETYNADTKTLTFYYDWCDEPVELIIDGKSYGKVGKWWSENGSFDVQVELTPGTHTLEMTWNGYNQYIRTITVAGAATPKPTAKPTATPKPTATAKPAAVKSVTVTKADKKVSSVTVNLGETVQLGYTLKPAGATSTVKWSSAKKSIAKVDANGVVTGVKEGSTKITVTTANKKKATVTVKVVDPYKPTKIAIANGKKATLKVGDTLQLGYTLTPANAKGTVKWSSSHSALRRLRQQCRGLAIFSFYYPRKLWTGPNRYGKMMKIKWRFMDKEDFIMKKFLALMLVFMFCFAALAEVAEPVEEYVSEVEVGLDAMGMEVAEFTRPTSATYDTAKSELTLYLDFYDGPIDVEVDSNKIGVITGFHYYGTGSQSFTYSVALGAGKHQIDLTYNHMVQDTTTITVAAPATPKPTAKPTPTPKPAAVKTVYATKADKKVTSVTVNLGETVQLGYKVTPAAATTTVKWSTAKKSIAKVDANGVVTGVKEGSTKITVTTANKKKATVTVTVVDPYKPTKIAINQGKKYTMYVGEQISLGYKLTPANAKTSVDWTSANKKVAAVDIKEGVVTAKKAGTAKITVTTANKKKATITITVKKASAAPKKTGVELASLIGLDFDTALKQYGGSATDTETVGGPNESFYCRQYSKNGVFFAVYYIGDASNQKYLGKVSVIERHHIAGEDTVEGVKLFDASDAAFKTWREKGYTQHSDEYGNVSFDKQSNGDTLVIQPSVEDGKITWIAFDVR